MKPTPVRVEPDTVRPVIAWMPGPVRPSPPGVAAVQCEPSDEVHTTTSWWPGVVPNVPVTVNVPPATASAVTLAWPAGTGRLDSVQVMPPLPDRAAISALVDKLLGEAHLMIPATLVEMKKPVEAPTKDQ